MTGVQTCALPICFPVTIKDFMFSGTTYPKDPIFLNAVEIEVHNMVNQLSSHPSLLIWCGNNEIEVAWKNWGWQQKYGLHGTDSVEHWQNYLFMFDTLLPGIIKEWSPAVPYLRSSPVGNWGNLQQMVIWSYMIAMPSHFGIVRLAVKEGRESYFKEMETSLS